MDHERDSGLMSAPESELLHAVVRAREENARLTTQLEAARLKLAEYMLDKLRRQGRAVPEGAQPRLVEPTA